MAQVFPGDGHKFTALVPINRGFGRLHIAGSAGLDFDKTEDLLVPADQVDFAAPVGCAKIPGNHHVSQLPQVEIGVFLASAAGAEVFSAAVRWQGPAGDPVEDANCGVSNAAGKHERKRDQSLRLLEFSGELCRVPGAGLFARA